MQLADLAERRVGIWGAGREGQAAAAALIGNVRALLMFDDSAAALSRLELDLKVTGDFEDLLGCDVVVLSPGIPTGHPLLGALRARGVTLTSGTDLWLSSYAASTIGVTGTKGKSTTAALLHLLIEASGGQATLAGNIGVPLLRVHPEPGTTVVAELSSYQCASITCSPRIAIVTGLHEEHLDWHGSLEDYWRDKAKVFTAGCDVLICDHDVEAKFRGLGLLTADGPTAVRTPFWPASLNVDRLPPWLRATHNRENLELALAAVAELGTPMSAIGIQRALADYHALPNRLEEVASRAGIRWVADVLATTAESVVAALTTYSDPPVTLIMGGQDRGLNYAALTEYLSTRVPEIRLIVTGETQQRLAGLLRPVPGVTSVTLAGDMAEAVALAKRQTPSGGVVLLSPGAPSYDEYPSHEAKAAAFRLAVERS